MTEQRLNFQAEVSRLLDIVAHSLYSEKEIFLRELISNASDACDRLRYAALTQPELSADDPNLGLRLSVDKEKRTLTIADNGIGMNQEELVANLGTIARSGTAEFMSRMSGDSRKDVSLIGQFGVGFYSAFMVAERVEVLTRRAGEAQGWHWESDGRGSFTVGEAAAPVSRGTRVILHLREGENEYLEDFRLREIIRKYSDHIALPIRMGDDAEAAPLNAASALWLRSKSEISAEQYKEFYHHVGHAFDEPWLNIHWRAEGKIEYSALLFVPSSKPFDLFDPKRAHRVKLYVRRVFITEGVEELLPPHLRFLRGVVDSEDLPLNVSREMLQNNPTVSRIKAGLTKKVLGELARKTEDTEAYGKFWENFGAVLKEGLVEDFENRDTLFKLLRFHSTHGPGLVSLEDYVGRMKEGQDAIFVLTGDDRDALMKSPQIEGFRARGVEVLLLTDPVDEFWIGGVGAYKDKKFKSVTRGGADLSKIKAEEKAEPDKPAAAEGDLATLLALFRQTLGENVKDVRASQRLTDSPVCLVADDGDLDMHLERMLRQHRQLDTVARRVLEINPTHPLIRRLSEEAGRDGASDRLADFAWLLLDQARIIEGEHPGDPAAFARRFSTLLSHGLERIAA